MEQAVTTEPAPTVWIVEDDEAVRDSFAAFLDMSGMNVRGFASAEEYLAARDGTPDGCLLLDLNLPGMGGLDLLDYLRSEGDDVPTVIVTARHDVGVDERARRAGVIAVFDKPAEWQALLAAIRRAFDRSPN